jgi:hypothetical protein
MIIFILIRLIILLNPSIYLDSPTNLNDLVTSNSSQIENKVFLLDHIIQLCTPSLFYSIILYLLYKGSLIGSVKLIEIKHDSGKSIQDFIKYLIDLIKNKTNYLKSFSFLALFSLFTRPFKSKSSAKDDWFEEGNRKTKYYKMEDINTESNKDRENNKFRNSDSSIYDKAFNGELNSNVEQIDAVMKLLENKGKISSEMDRLSFLDELNIYAECPATRNSIISLRSAIASSIGVPQIPIDYNKPLPPLPISAQQRLEQEMIEKHLINLISKRFNVQLLSIPEDVTSRNSSVSNYSSASNNTSRSKYSNDDSDSFWSLIPIFTFNVEIIDLTVKDYNLWCTRYDDFIISLNKPLPILPINKDLPNLSLHINSPIESCSNYLLTLGDINLCLTNHNLWSLMFLILILLGLMLPFYLLIINNISNKLSWRILFPQLLRVGYLYLKRFLLNINLLVIKLVRNILRSMIQRGILALILLTIIYVFNLQEYVPSVVINKLSANPFLAPQLDPSVVPPILLEPLSAHTINIESIDSVTSANSADSSANYQMLKWIIMGAVGVILLGALYYYLNSKITDLQNTVDLLKSDEYKLRYKLTQMFKDYHNDNTIQLLEDKVQDLTNQQSMLDGKILAQLTNPQSLLGEQLKDSARRVSVDPETNSIYEVLFGNRITRVDLPSTTQEIKELALVSLALDELM